MAAVLPLTATGQTTYAPLGSEYAIAGQLPGDQVYPRVSLQASGGFLVWQDNVTDGSGMGLSALRLDNSFSGVYSPFRVNQEGAGEQDKPDVTLLNSGGAAFVWQGGVPGFQHIYARFLTASNTWVGGDILVNSATNTGQLGPSLATLAGGNVVVTWASLNQAAVGSMQDVYGQVLSPTGQKVGGEFPVNQFTSYNQRNPAVAALSDGRFVVVWVSEQQRFGETYGGTNQLTVMSASVDVYARIFSASGAPLGSEFLVNTGTNVCSNPRVAGAADGTFMVVWAERGFAIRENGWDIWARPFSAAGVGGTVRRVNSTVYGDQYAPSVTTSGSDYLAVWTSMAQDGSWEGVYGQFLRNDAAPVGDEFLVNTTTLSRQMHPALTGDGAGRFLVVWTSFGGGPNSFDLYAQRFVNVAQPLPALQAPIVNAPFTVVNGAYQPQLQVSWPVVAGFAGVTYEVYVDGAVNPTATVTNNSWTLSGITASSTHSFQVDYVLVNGRRSPLSAAASGTAWSGIAFRGIPVEWFNKYYPDGNWPSPTDDWDHDGMTTWQEFLAGTDPTDPNSALRQRLRTTGQGIYLEWNTHPGFVYQVQSKTNLAADTWANLGAPRFAAGAVDSLYVGGTAAGYYRIVLVR